MSTSRFRVLEVVSPGSVLSDQQQVYVLRGVPDVDEEVARFAEARLVTEHALLGKELTYEDEDVKELPDLPGLEVEAFDDRGLAVTPWLAARVAGVLAGYPFK